MGKSIFSVKRLIFVLVCILVYSCASTKYVPDGDYLLNKVTLKYFEGSSTVPSLKNQIRQRPNSKVLGLFKVQLAIYNISGRKDKRINNWFKRVGEEPVIYREYLADRSLYQLETYLRNKGYYSASVSDTVLYSKKKAHVIYTVNTGPRTYVGSVDFKDRNNIVKGAEPVTTNMSKLRLADTSESLLHTGMPLDVDILEDERDRVSKTFRDNGYYAFSPKYVRYFADTVTYGNPDTAKLITSVVIPKADSLAEVVYRIGDISVNMNFDQLLAIKNIDTMSYSTLVYDGILFKYIDKLNLKPKAIAQCLQFATGDLYNTEAISQTYSRIQALNLYKYVNIVLTVRKGEMGVLDCEIQLTPLKKQSYNVFIEGTNNSGNIGVGGNLTYNHRNLFGGAENFSLRVWGALKKERMKENNFFSTVEYGVDVTLETPQFWFPFFNFYSFRKKHAPHTSVMFSFSSENTPYYDRDVSSVKFGYWWKKGDQWRFDVNIADVNYVKMSRMDSLFFASLKNKYVLSSYTSHVVASGNVAATYYGKNMNKASSYSWMRFNFESAGNLMYGLSSLFNAHKSSDTTGSYYNLFGVKYAQYVKADFDFRYHQAFNASNAFVYRFFIGLGYPYGNMKALPFEEAYYCGGANDMRAWHARMLGPGSYYSERYPNSVGDFKLEFNWEYRFKLFWLLEGALFVDAGNVWKISNTEKIPGSLLKSDFYKDIAIDCGPGIRLDVNFFLVRVDWGIRLRDPSKAPGQRFVLFDNGKWMKNTVLNIAIGYPF